MTGISVTTGAAVVVVVLETAGSVGMGGFVKVSASVVDAIVATSVVGSGMVVVSARVVD
jgi:altronate dehydratase